MTKTKAIFIWLALFALLIPCVFVISENEDALGYVLFGALWTVTLFVVLKCSPVGRKFVRTFENATFVLFGISTEE